MSTPHLQPCGSTWSKGHNQIAASLRRLDAACHPDFDQSKPNVVLLMIVTTRSQVSSHPLQTGRGLREVKLEDMCCST